MHCKSDATAKQQRFSWSPIGPGLLKATSAQIRERVVAARRRQQERFAGKRNVTRNARMGPRDLKAYCALDEATLELLKMAVSGRSKSPTWGRK